MISIEKSIRQMAWADEKLFKHLLTLPDEAWRTKIQEGEWPVYKLVFHLIASADWYAYNLGAVSVFHKEIDSIEEIRGLGDTWRTLNNYLVEQSARDEETLTFEEGGETHEVLRSTVLSQAIIHSVEHRVHIASALKVSGYELPDLEDFSVWGYVDSLS